MSLLGRLGVWTWFDMMPAAKAAETAKKIEEWGYSALWLPEAVGRDPFATDLVPRRRTRAGSSSRPASPTSTRATR